MIGAVVFVVFMLLFVALTFVFPALPPGDLLQEMIGIPSGVDYQILGIETNLLISALFNGVIYGIIIWLAFSIVNKIVYAKGDKKSEVVIKTKD